MVFADDAGGRVHGGESSGRTGGAFDIEEGDALAVGRESGRIDIAVESGETPGRIAVEMREIEIGLAAEVRAIGEEGEGGGVGRPDGVRLGAGAVGRRGGGDALAMAEIVEGSNENHPAVEPGDALAVGRNGDLADHDGAPLAVWRWTGVRGAGRGSLGANRQEGGCAEDERQGGAAEAAKHEMHSRDVSRGRRTWRRVSEVNASLDGDGSAATFFGEVECEIDYGGGSVGVGRVTEDVAPQQRFIRNRVV